MADLPRHAADASSSEAVLKAFVLEYLEKHGFPAAAAAMRSETAARTPEYPLQLPPVCTTEGLLFDWFGLFWEVYSNRARAAFRKDPERSAIRGQQIQLHTQNPPTRTPTREPQASHAQIGVSGVPQGALRSVDGQPGFRQSMYNDMPSAAAANPPASWNSNHQGIMSVQHGSRHGEIASANGRNVVIAGAATASRQPSVGAPVAMGSAHGPAPNAVLSKPNPTAAKSSDPIDFKPYGDPQHPGQSSNLPVGANTPPYSSGMYGRRLFAGSANLYGETAANPTAASSALAPGRAYAPPVSNDGSGVHFEDSRGDVRVPTAASGGLGSSTKLQHDVNSHEAPHRLVQDAGAPQAAAGYGLSNMGAHGPGEGNKPGNSVPAQPRVGTESLSVESREQAARRSAAMNRYNRKRHRSDTTPGIVQYHPAVARAMPESNALGLGSRQVRDTQPGSIPGQLHPTDPRSHSDTPDGAYKGPRHVSGGTTTNSFTDRPSSAPIVRGAYEGPGPAFSGTIRGQSGMGPSLQQTSHPMGSVSGMRPTTDLLTNRPKKQARTASKDQEAGREFPDAVDKDMHSKGLSHISDSGGTDRSSETPQGNANRSFEPSRKPARGTRAEPSSSRSRTRADASKLHMSKGNPTDSGEHARAVERDTTRPPSGVDDGSMPGPHVSLPPEARGVSAVNREGLSQQSALGSNRVHAQAMSNTRSSPPQMERNGGSSEEMPMSQGSASINNNGGTRTSQLRTDLLMNGSQELSDTVGKQQHGASHDAGKSAPHAQPIDVPTKPSPGVTVDGSSVVSGGRQGQTPPTSSGSRRPDDKDAASPGARGTMAVHDVHSANGFAEMLVSGPGLGPAGAIGNDSMRQFVVDVAAQSELIPHATDPRFADRRGQAQLDAATDPAAGSRAATGSVQSTDLRLLQQSQGMLPTREPGPPVVPISNGSSLPNSAEGNMNGFPGSSFGQAPQGQGDPIQARMQLGRMGASPPTSGAGPQQGNALSISGAQHAVASEDTAPGSNPSVGGAPADMHGSGASGGRPRLFQNGSDTTKPSTASPMSPQALTAAMSGGAHAIQMTDKGLVYYQDEQLKIYPGGQPVPTFAASATPAINSRPAVSMQTGGVPSTHASADAHIQQPSTSAPLSEVPAYSGSHREQATTGVRQGKALGSSKDGEQSASSRLAVDADSGRASSDGSMPPKKAANSHTGLRGLPRGATNLSRGSAARGANTGRGSGSAGSADAGNTRTPPDISLRAGGEDDTGSVKSSRQGSHGRPGSGTPSQRSTASGGSNGRIPRRASGAKPGSGLRRGRGKRVSGGGAAHQETASGPSSRRISKSTPAREQNASVPATASVAEPNSPQTRTDAAVQRTPVAEPFSIASAAANGPTETTDRATNPDTMDRHAQPGGLEAYPAGHDLGRSYEPGQGNALVASVFGGPTTYASDSGDVSTAQVAAEPTSIPRPDQAGPDLSQSEALDNYDRDFNEPSGLGVDHGSASKVMATNSFSGYPDDIQQYLAHGAEEENVFSNLLEMNPMPRSGGHLELDTAGFGEDANI